MDFDFSERSKEWLARVQAFMDAHVYPNEELYESQLHADPKDPWHVPEIMLELRDRAKATGLWTMHMHDPQYGAGLSNIEYAPIAELLGRVHFASEIFNCNAPDSGNMDVLALYGTPEQKEKWLVPMVEGQIKSSFAMTEPDVASSDATNVRTSIVRDGNDYVINGKKWWITNAYNPRTKIFIVMGKTDPTAPTHLQQTQILVEPSTPGVKILRPLHIFGYSDAPHGHAEILFDNVRVPASNVILGEGRGFEIAQGRLGPGRIHHAMRLIGVAELALERMCKRLSGRVAFGNVLADESIWQQRISDIRIDIEMCRLLVYRAAWKMDTVGTKAARSEIAQIKVAVPRAVQAILDTVIQAFGAAGMCDDFGLGYMYTRTRTMRLGDGPDEVHCRAIAKHELRKYRGFRPEAAKNG